MKGNILTYLFLITAFVLAPVLSIAGTDQGAAADPSLSQPLIREGTLAVDLAVAFKLGAPTNEAEGEDLLSEAGVAPRNGWIADYPLTPDIIGELQTAIGASADSGKLPMGKDAALQTFQDVMKGYDVLVKTDTSEAPGEESVPNYPDSEEETNYYQNEGPPVVTYYAPPPDYAYMYTWVPYPFWWSDSWFPGFFVLADFSVRTHYHHHDRDHDKDHHDGDLVTNHFHDPKSGKVTRIDPANRVHVGFFPRGVGAGAAAGATSARSSAQAIPGAGRAGAITKPREQFRGYGVGTNTAGIRSSAFEHAVDSGSQHAASDRGFQSRSRAGQLPTRATGGGSRGYGGGGTAHGGGGGGFHGGGFRK